MEALRRDLEDRYDFILLHVLLYSYSWKKRKIAEIDLLAVEGKRYDIYEVKCSHRITKARKQLQRIRRLLEGVRYTYFYCGASRQLHLV